MQYTVREAAKYSGLWEKAPYMEEISSDVFKKFYDHVSALDIHAIFSSCKYLYIIGDRSMIVRRKSVCMVWPIEQK
jgi:hypothetical protein